MDALTLAKDDQQERMSRLLLLHEGSAAAADLGIWEQHPVRAASLNHTVLRSTVHAGSGFGGADDGDDLELHEVVPVGDPLIEQSRFLGLHELEAAVETALVDPTLQVREAGRQHPTARSGACID